MSYCVTCGSTEKLTKHHIGDESRIVVLCEKCHQRIHNSVEVNVIKNALRRITRARKRIMRDSKIILESEKMLEKEYKVEVKKKESEK